MTARIIDGKAIAASINAETATEVRTLTESGRMPPGLAVILVGDDPASAVYVRTKVRTCGEVGIHSMRVDLPASARQEDVLDAITDLNRDPRIHGILLQSPVPVGLDEKALTIAIDPAKDVDCFHPVNVGRLALEEDGLLPCTPAGIMELMARTGIDTAGKHAVVLGRSNIVGKPMALLLARKSANATVTICHSHTRNLAEHLRRADIIVAAIGKPEFVTADMVKDGAVVIDVGINRVDGAAHGGRALVGDVAYAEVAAKAGYITPVPGGVGPMTIAMLMRNTLRARRMAGD